MKRTLLFAANLTIFVAMSVDAQPFRINGRVATGDSAVQRALVTFVDERDTSNRYSAFTDSLGGFTLSVVVTNIPKITPSIPSTFQLAQNYPNPFSSSTSVPYDLVHEADVTMKVYDILGREVRSLLAGRQERGAHTALWDGRNNSGRKVAEGVYLCRLISGHDSRAIKMVAASGYSHTAGIASVNVHLPQTKVPESGTHEYSGSSFTVKVGNTSQSYPRIWEEEFNEVQIHSDTALTIGVLSGKIVYVKADTIPWLSTYLHRTRLYTMEIDGTGITRLKNGDDFVDGPLGRKAWPYVNEPRWSWDGKKIVFSESWGPDESHVTMIDADGSNRKILGGDGYSVRPKWGPSSDRILYCGLGLSIVDTNRNNHRVIPGSSPHYFEGDSVYLYGEANWQHDGDHLYIEGSVGRFPDTIVVNPNVELFSCDISTGTIVARLTRDTIDESWFEPSHDGQQFLVLTGNYFSTTVLFIPFGGDVQSKVEVGCIEYPPHWSNDDRFLVLGWDADPDPYSTDFLITLMDTKKGNVLKSITPRGLKLEPTPDIFVTGKAFIQ